MVEPESTENHPRREIPTPPEPPAEVRRPIPQKLQRNKPVPPERNPDAPGRGTFLAPKVPRKDTVLLTNVAKRAADVSSDELKNYLPSNGVLAITELVMSGVVRRADIANALGITQETVSTYLGNPLDCAWMMHKISSMVGDRLAMIDAAMYSRALGGDVAAAKLIFERYAPTVQTHRMIHSASDDLAELSDSELLKLANSHQLIEHKEEEE